MRRWCLLPRARLRGGSFSKPRGFYPLRVVACWLGSGLEGWFASVLEYRSLERRVCAVYVAQGSGYRGLIRLADPSLLRGLEVDIWPFGYLTDVDGELTPRRLRSILAISRASSRFVSTRLVAGGIETSPYAFAWLSYILHINLVDTLRAAGFTVPVLRLLGDNSISLHLPLHLPLPFSLPVICSRHISLYLSCFFLCLLFYLGILL